MNILAYFITVVLKKGTYISVLFPTICHKRSGEHDVAPDAIWLMCPLFWLHQAVWPDLPPSFKTFPVSTLLRSSNTVKMFFLCHITDTLNSRSSASSTRTQILQQLARPLNVPHSGYLDNLSELLGDFILTVLLQESRKSFPKIQLNKVSNTSVKRICKTIVRNQDFPICQILIFFFASLQRFVFVFLISEQFWPKNSVCFIISERKKTSHLVWI